MNSELLVDPGTPDDAERYIERLGCGLHDKWILRSLVSPCGDPQQPANAECAACRSLWPETLLWPGRLRAHASEEEVASIKDALINGAVLGCAVVVRGRRLSEGTEIIAEDDTHVLELCPGPLIVRPPSLCPPCYHSIQRRPVNGALQPFTVLVRSPPEASRFVPMQTVLARSVDAFRSRQHMILEEEEITLGQGRRAMLLLLSGWDELQRALRLALPGSSVDYLPHVPSTGPFLVTVAAARWPIASSLSPQEVAGWLSLAGKCDVLNCSWLTGGEEGKIIAEVQDVVSWRRALALNGELFKSTVVIVRHKEHAELGATQPLATLWPAIPRRRMELHWLRALRPLPKAARRLVLRFLPVAPVMVPADVPSIEEALAMEPDRIELASGVYLLREGLRLRGPIELVGSGDGLVELVVGAPIVVSSQHGARICGLTIVAWALRFPEALQPPSLVCVHSSYIIARGRAFEKYSEMTPQGRQWTFASCMYGKPAIVIKECRLQGGHHALDVRGSTGLRTRAGRSNVARRERGLGFDLAAWLMRSSTSTPSPRTSNPVRLQCACPGTMANCPRWSAHPMTRVHLLDCEVHGAEQDAIHVWRGGELEMQACWVHDCAQGVTVTRCVEADSHIEKGWKEPLPELIIVDSRFEDISANPCSSALSIGQMVSYVASNTPAIQALPHPLQNGPQISRYKDLHNDMRQADYDGYMRVCLTRNTVCRCSVGFVACNAKLHAMHNKLLDLRLAAFQLCDVFAELTANIVERCGGTAFSLNAMASCSNTDGNPSHFAFARLNGNTYRGCNIGIRVTAAKAAGCKLEAREETMESNGDGAIILSPHCHAKLVNCAIRGSQRCAVRIGRGARGHFDHCSMSSNGRAVAVAASSAAEVLNCSFDNNVGWAVRLEGATSMATTLSHNATTVVASSGASSGSVIAGNVFGCGEHGSVGRKRVRIDDWADGRARIEGNVEDDGQTVVPVLKRRRNVEEEAEEVAERLGGMSLDAPGYTAS